MLFGIFLLPLIGLAALLLAAWHLARMRSARAKSLYLSQCDAALQYPQFANPQGELDMRAKTVAGEKRAFEQYEWYVARLVYVLDECMMLSSTSRWRTVAETQLGVHKHYFGSDYYKKQDYLPHYSPSMRRLIEEQANAA